MSVISTAAGQAGGGDLYRVDGLEPQEGFTRRTSLVILYGAFILMPANLYLMLVAGQNLITPIHFIALILWVEMCKFSRKPLSTAEAFIVYAISGVAAGQMLFYYYALMPAYFRVSDIANNVFISSKTGQSFAELAPWWWAPSAEAVRARSFFHQEWVVPILIGVVVWVFTFMADLSMGIIGRELFIKREKLPFPFARPTADACIALTQQRPELKRCFTIAGLVGTIWGLVVYWPVAAGKKIVNYPIPWADFNTSVHTAWGGALRGASLGVATDILAFTGGFIVPFRVIVCMLIGGLALQFVGNIVAVQTGVFQRFVTGMSIRTTLLNQVPVWMSVWIAGLAAAGLLHIFGSPMAFINAFRGLRSTGESAREVGGLGLKWLLVLFFGSVLGAVILFKILIPAFPVWFIAPFALMWSFVFSLIDMRAIGTTGFRVDPPYVREGLIIGANHYTPVGAKVWFAPWPIALGASGWVQNFKICDLVNCKPVSYIKASLVAIPVGMLANFVFISIFWNIAPIPSATYPYADTILPIQAQNLCIWMSTTTQVVNPDPTYSIANIFRWDWMLITFGIFTAIFIFNRLYRFMTGRNVEFVSLIGLAVGMTIPLPFTVSLFIGGLLAMAVKWRWGAQWFNTYRNVLVAGLVVGEGVVIGICAAIAALKNSLVAIPY